MTLSERIAHGPTPSQMPQDTRCPDEWRGVRCERPADHAGMIHRAGDRTWGFADNATPEWLRRMRIAGLPPKEMPL